MSKLSRVKLRIFLHVLWSIRSTVRAGLKNIRSRVRAGLKTFDLQLWQV